MAYGSVYVARVAMGADDVQTLRAFQEAEAYDGPSLIIAYSHCIAHGIDMRKGLEQQKLGVQSGHWPLYRYNPLLADEGKHSLILDSKAPSVPLEQYAYNETRYRMLQQSDAERAEALMRDAKHDVQERWGRYQQLAEAQPDGKPLASAQPQGKVAADGSQSGTPTKDIQSNGRPAVES
jgi:pyruvate-ferredoxin/flavodoxin oxidoreductase